MTTRLIHIIPILLIGFTFHTGHSQNLSESEAIDSEFFQITDTLPSDDKIMAASNSLTSVSGFVPEYIGDIWPEMPMPAQLRAVTMPTPSLSTGAAVFSVPLYELKYKNLTIPFSLNYRSNGIKLNEDPFPVGYGWSFLPALRITRRVLGRPDGYQERTIPDEIEAIDANLSHGILHRSVAPYGRSINPELDPEYDLFTVFLPDRTFNAYYSGGRLISPGNTEYRITVRDSFKSLEVASPDGIIWNFGTIGFCNAQSVTCEWCLADITLPSGETIGFEWQQGVHSIQPNVRPLIKQNYYATYKTASFPHTELDGYIEGPNVEPDAFLNLKKIIFPGGCITFSYFTMGNNFAAVLRSMDVNYEGQEVDNITLSHQIAARATPLLKSVKTTDGLEYTFAYNPGRFIKVGSEDYWGFYNGRNTSNLTAPGMTVNYLGRDGTSIEFGGSDRRVDVNNMKAMILERAVHPTGAITEWEYEEHKFSPVSFRDEGISGTVESTLCFGGGLRVKEIRMFENNDDQNPRIVRYSYGSNGNGLAQVEALPTASTFLQNLILVAPRFTLEDPPTPHPDWLICEYGLLMFNPYSNYAEKRFGEELIWYDEVSEIQAEGKTVHHFVKQRRNEVFHEELGATAPYDIQTWFSPDIYESKTEFFKQTGSSYSLVESTGFEYDAETGKDLCGLHIQTNKAQMTIATSKPHFDELRYLFFPWETIPNNRDYPTPDFGTYYRYGDGEIYIPIPYTISSDVIRLKKRIHTTYTSNLPYTVTEEYSYSPGTQLLLSKTEKSAAQTLRTVYSYPDPKDSKGALMVAANVVGIPVGGSITYGSNTVKWSAAISAFCNNRYFRVNSLNLQRGSNPVYAVASYGYTTGGQLKSVRNFGETEVEYTWDMYGRYPLSMTVGGTLTSKAEWKPLVGISSLTDPAGTKTLFSYDTGNRLKAVSLNGKIQKDYIYSIKGNGDNSITTRHYTSPSEYFSTVERYDGLGRPYASYTQTPTGWIGILREYDAMNRPWRRWIPVSTTSTTLSPSALSQQAVSDSGDSKPYRDTQYEESPRGMIVAETMEGAAWHDNNKRKVISVYTNDSKDHRCNRYSPTGSGVTKNGLWPDGSLLISLHKDEDGLTVEMFKDLRGKTVCEKRGEIATYYVYDDYGDLRYILPPGAEAGGQRTDSKMQGIAFWYDYDGRGRCILKKLPGAKPHLLRYDPDNRLVAENTVNHPDDEWRIHAYDQCGRPVVSVDCNLTESEVTTYSSVARTATYTGSSSLMGYTISGSPSAKVTDGTVVTAYFYDSYGFISGQSLGDLFTFQDPLNTLKLSSRVADKDLLCTAAGKADGKLTGLYTGQGWEAYYYDDDGREIQRYATGYNRGYRVSVYNYYGSVAEVHHSYNYTGKPRPIMLTSISGLRDRDIHYSYDNTGRPVKTLIIERYLTTKPTANKTDSATVVFSYDDTGRLNCIKQGSVTRNLSYDIHGWPKTLSTVLNGAGITESMLYEKGLKPRYNGFISVHTLNGQGYAYTYDHRGFLLQSKIVAGDLESDCSAAMQYDDRGNLIELERRGVIDILPTGERVFGVLETLDATYDGNRMTQVDIESDAEVYDLKPGFHRTGASEITYDASGRMISDGSRGIADVTYDNNGYPLTFTVKDRNSLVTNIIDSFGRRLMTGQSMPIPTTKDTKTSEYTGDGHVIRDGILEMSRFTGGYFDADLNPHYYIQDYQGNNIGVHDRDGNLEQQVNYYPYGEPYLEPRYTKSGEENRYLFGDKERFIAGRAKGYDFHARSYASPQCRFTTLDPLAEKTPWLSPYAYCASNPVNYIDPDGKDICVLNYGYDNRQHMAMLIQNEIGQWQYYSVNGNNVYMSGKFQGGRPFNDVAIGSWNSPEEFLNSSYNVRNDDSQENPNMNHFGYSEGFKIPTSPEQDEIMRNSFMEKSKTRYTLLGNNCATTVQSVLFEAGIPVAKPTYEKIHVPANKFLGEPEYNIVRPNINPLPSAAFKSIMQLNPQGTYIQKR